ncbi:MAG: GTPase Era [Gammaproteobacteria bacterium]|nr:MAG: GTPase Era [Gammaproteobacteria bacterium]
MQDPEEIRCGTIAIIGHPNVGKSTLLNNILGEKLTITSSKPQTTRHQILGIKTQTQTQAIYIDTPGIHPNAQRRLSRTMVRSAINALINVDIIGFVIEALRWTVEDDAILDRLKQQQQPVLLIVNKIDKIKDKSRLLPFLQSCSEKMSFLAIIPVSAQKGKNIDELEKVIADALPIAEFVYPADQFTDRSSRFLAAEFIREKLMRSLYEELPYWLTVSIEQFNEQKKIIKISAVIWTERASQKAIIIGKNGALLKKIGTEARKDMETSFGKKVYLELWVKVKAGWSEEEGIL